MRPGTETSKDRGQWSSEPAFVFSMAAAAVGLGNLWRFPYLAGEYGGGGFILAYLVAMVVVGLPLMYLEVDAVRQDVRPFAEFSAGYASLAWVLVILALGAILLLRGLRALETLAKFMMPVLLLVVVGLVATASRTAGWEQAKDFLLTTDLSALRDPSLDSSSQQNREALQPWVISRSILRGEVRRKPGSRSPCSCGSASPSSGDHRPGRPRRGANWAMRSASSEECPTRSLQRESNISTITY